MATAKTKALNKGMPIAVLDRFGVILPFTQNGVDAIHLLKHGVTYIYTEEELKRAQENQKYLDAHDFESPKMFTEASNKLRLLRPPRERNAESRVQIIDPEYVDVGEFTA